ncbi:ATPase AAA [Bradyrhizobium sp. AT1]|uniref:DUF499 domain-containing protein n=1 Tax=Bradyrhizobium sp. AT1 TaxID=574934 RepID=UPI000797302A|nr:DUF499 domain-containing protein [Bradyrhizobium sp. AT1]KYG22519.1 ATPase AAA [Bradyrhizobium sp. AT1]
MPIATIKQLCVPNAIITSDSLVEQVAQIEDFATGNIDGRDFFRRNHFTAGLELLVKRGFDRLAGKSDDGAFYLTQAMGGGKTHSLIALGLLASDPGLRREVVPKITVGNDFAAAKVVIFNGHQNPNTLLWGYIAEQLGRGDVMAPFWRNGARTPGVDEWVSVLGDQPVLILLDELPSYLQMAQGEAVGNTTLGDLTIGALERLFNALPRCPRACVVVTNLKDDVYLDGSGQLRTLIESLTKHYDRNAQAITPVQQNTGEVFAIVRKRLFDALPSADKIDEIAQAYVSALQKAKRVDTIPTTPETFIERIRETYPFHPSIRDIVARFAENRGYQKTRALIRLMRLAVRGALTGNGNAFLVGLQHLDFNDQATIEEIRKINPGYSNAISRDVADRGNALAEKIDAADGNPTASAVAKMLLMSSLSAAESPLRGLTDGELIETLVDPLLDVSEIKGSLSRLEGQAWYLFKGVDNRVFFGQTANVTAEITEIAGNIATEQVDQTLRDKLKEVFKPRTGALYSENIAILPALDDIKLDDERPSLIILEQPADKLPQEFDDWWNKQDLQNRVLVLTADRNAVATLRTSARRQRAIAKVEERIKAQHGQGSPQMAELDGVRAREAAAFTSALRETFKSIVFPMRDRAKKSYLRSIDDFRMEFDRNDYSGEQQIVDTLSKRGKFISSDKFDAEFETLRLDAEEILFDADAVQQASLRRNAAVRSGWFWLPKGGLEQLTRAAVQRGFWREKDGLIAKKWERVTRVTARQDDFAQDPIITGRFQVNVAPEDADIVYVSESGPPDPARSQKLDGRVYETAAPAVWFLGVDSKGVAKTGEPCEWRAPIRVKPDVKRTSTGYRVSLVAIPRAATIRATFDGSDPKGGPEVPHGDMDAPAGAKQLRVVAAVNGQFGPEETAPLASGMDDTGGPRLPQPKAALKPDAAATMTSRFEPKDTAAAFSALDRLAKLPDAKVFGGTVDLNGARSEGDFLTLRLGRDVALPAAALDQKVKELATLLASSAPTVKLRLDGIAFSSGRDLMTFCDAFDLDFDRVEWKQE